MLTRSEAIAKKKAAKNGASGKEAPRATADGRVKCPACEEEVEVAKLERSPSGALECSSCGGPIDAAATPREVPPEKSKIGAVAPPQMYCDECGAAWPRVGADQRVMPNCGHTSGMVDDPAKARTYKPPAGHAFDQAAADRHAAARAIPEKKGPAEPALDRSSAAPPPPRMVGGGDVALRLEHDRVTLGWGRCTFKVSDYNSVGTEPITLSAVVPPGKTRSEVARELLAEAEAIADEMIKRELAWWLRTANEIHGGRDD